MADKLLRLFEEEIVGGYADTDTVIELTDVADLVGETPVTLAIFRTNDGNAKQAFDAGNYEEWHLAAEGDINATTSEVTVTRGHNGTTAQTIASGDTWKVYNYVVPEMWDDKANLAGGNTFTGDQNLSTGMYQIGGEDIFKSNTYTPTLTPSTSGSITLDTSLDVLSYRVYNNNMVNVFGAVSIASVSSPVGRIDVSVPFPVSNTLEGVDYSAPSIIVRRVVSANVSDFVGVIFKGESVFKIYLGDGIEVQGDSAEQIEAGTILYVNLWYPK